MGSSSQGTKEAVSGPTMLSGLVNLNVESALANVSVNANAQDVAVNVSEVLNDVQAAALVQALDINATAKATADRLTSALQEKGLLTSTERVVGYNNGVIYKMGTKTQ